MSNQLNYHENFKKELRGGFTSRVASVGARFNTRAAQYLDAPAKDVVPMITKTCNQLRRIYSSDMNGVSQDTLKVAGDRMLLPTWVNILSTRNMQ
jgi:hypothetical protein